MVTIAIEDMQFGRLAGNSATWLRKYIVIFYMKVMASKEIFFPRVALQFPTSLAVNAESL